MGVVSTKLTHDIAYIAVFAALIIALAFFAIPAAAGIPIVLQNAAIIMAGLILGGRRGFLASLLFLGIGMLGIPVLPGGRATLTALAGPSIGYLIGYLLSPLAAGAIAYTKRCSLLVLAVAGLVGLAVQYACGAVGLMARGGLSLGAAVAAQGAFLVPDLIKIAVIVVAARAVHQAFRL